MVSVTENTTNGDSAGKDKITEYIKVQSELRELDAQIWQKKQEEFKNLRVKLGKIEEKNNCGSVRFLDRLANFFEFGGKNVADKIRNFTFKISAPCSLPFTKKK